MKDVDLTTLPNSNSFDFLEPDEREELHQLKISLPSYGERIRDAKNRLKDRIANRRNRNK